MKRFKFKAKIEEGRGGGAYVVFPYGVEKEFGTSGQVPVKATFGGISYTGSLARYGQPEHILGVLKRFEASWGKDQATLSKWFVHLVTGHYTRQIGQAHNACTAFSERALSYYLC